MPLASARNGGLAKPVDREVADVGRVEAHVRCGRTPHRSCRPRWPPATQSSPSANRWPSRWRRCACPNESRAAPQVADMGSRVERHPCRNAAGDVAGKVRAELDPNLDGVGIVGLRDRRYRRIVPDVARTIFTRCSLRGEAPDKVGRQRIAGYVLHRRLHRHHRGSGL